MWSWLRARGTPVTPPPVQLDPAAIVRRARRLRFRARPDALAALCGAYQSARPGSGLIFAELKPYEPGDDVRHLDWNVTARQNRPYVRRYVEERALSLWLILDVSASMRFGPDGQSKADRAAQAAALLAAAAIHNGDRAGLVLVSDRIEAELPPDTGDRQLARLLRMLVSTPTSSRETALSTGLHRPGKRSRRGLIVALSDFLSPEPALPWQRASGRHEVIALRFVEPREKALPPAGLLAVQDLESGRRRIVDSGSKRVRASYARQAGARDRAFQSWCGETRVAGHVVSTFEDPIGPLLRIFHGRSDRRRGGS